MHINVANMSSFAEGIMSTLFQVALALTTRKQNYAHNTRPYQTKLTS